MLINSNSMLNNVALNVNGNEIELANDTDGLSVNLNWKSQRGFTCIRYTREADVTSN